MPCRVANVPASAGQQIMAALSLGSPHTSDLLRCVLLKTSITFECGCPHASAVALRQKRAIRSPFLCSLGGASRCSRGNAQESGRGRGGWKRCNWSCQRCHR